MNPVKPCWFEVFPVPFADKKTLSCVLQDCLQFMTLGMEALANVCLFPFNLIKIESFVPSLDLG